MAHSVLSTSFDLLIGARSIGWRHQELANGMGDSTESMFAADAVNLVELVEAGMEDASSFCREKYGASPEMELRRVGHSQPRDTCLLAPFVAFSLHEVLKNAMGAHVRRVGGDAGRLDDLPPIDVSVGFHNDTAFVRVVDSGGGFPKGSDARRALTFLRTTNPPREANYTYSRNFGSPFEGLGVGLPLARLHAQHLDGGLELGSLPGVGVTTLLHFDVGGGNGERNGRGGGNDNRWFDVAPPPFRPLALRQLHSFGQQPRTAAAAKTGAAFLATSTAEALASLSPAAAAVAAAAPNSAAAADLARLCAEAEPGAKAGAAAGADAGTGPAGMRAVDTALSGLEAAADALRSKEELSALLPAVPLAQLQALTEAARARALTLRLMQAQLSRVAGEVDPAELPAVTAHVHDVADLARDAADEARRIIGELADGPPEPRVVNVNVSGHGGCLTAPALLRRALVAVIGRALHAAGAPRASGASGASNGGDGGDSADLDEAMTVEVSADATRVGVRVLGPSAAQLLPRQMALEGTGAPFDGWAARLLARHLGGDVRWVWAPGRGQEVFLTVSRNVG